MPLTASSPRATSWLARFNSLLAAAACCVLAACGGGGGSTPAPAAGASAMLPASAIVSISASPTAAIGGQVLTLTWSASNTGATSCDASGAWSGKVATSGTQSVTAPAATATANTVSYTLNCGGVSNSAAVVVGAAPTPAPVVSIGFAPANVSAGQSTTLTWSSTGASLCVASGAWQGAEALAGKLALTPAGAGSFDYTLTCSGPGGDASASAKLAVSAVANNTASVMVDNGPAGSQGSINVPFVSVTVCRPGTAVCQTIDHVLVDTGSYGLRLMSPLNSALALPAVHTPAGEAAGECAQFVSGFTWGAIVQADVQIAGEVAPAQSVQLINSAPGGFAGVPASCSGTGGTLSTVAALGANGILGVGLFKEDCGHACAGAAIAGAYYSCTAGACTATAMPLAQQVSNPVASFANDNNGVILTFPPVASGGMTSLAGTLIFGIGTQANNSLGSETRYAANNSGNFTTVYKGTTMASSFIDSGSNGLYFDDQTLPVCRRSSDFYCPTRVLSLSATNSSFDGRSSGPVGFTLENLDTLGAAITAASIGGSNDSGQSSSGAHAFDWGLPFFFGRRVFIGLEAGASPKATGPYWAY
ncbi:MAG TPA: DUF3443 family protein [Telluria sp.]|nr:DUF3443 family protein [Telluria sp.]